MALELMVVGATLMVILMAVGWSWIRAIQLALREGGAAWGLVALPSVMLAFVCGEIWHAATEEAPGANAFGGLATTSVVWHLSKE
jgi:hypothetical protein